MKFSVVTTMYRSASYLKQFHNRIHDSLSQTANDFEVIFVNDGSPDDSLAVATEIAKKDARVIVVDLSRNFGHHKAMMAGLEQATGDYIFLIDCDLEEPPESFSTFWTVLQGDSALDVVYGVQATRKGKIFERVSGEVFYTLFNFLAQIKLPRNFTTCRLMSRRYVDALLKYGETEITIGGLWVIAGFSQKPVEIAKSFKGSSSYSITKKIDMMIEAIISFSDFPLNLIFRLGLFITFVSFIYIAILIYQVLILGYGTVGWPSLIVSVWLLGGLNILAVGVIGRYVAKIFLETKRRPRTIIRSVFRGQK